MIKVIIPNPDNTGMIGTGRGKSSDSDVVSSGVVDVVPTGVVVVASVE